MSYIGLLFAAAGLTDAVPPPPPPIVRTETIVVAGSLDGKPVEEPVEVVTIDTGDGTATTDRATYDKVAEATARNETDEEYGARLLRQLCEIKPWHCEVQL